MVPPRAALRRHRALVRGDNAAHASLLLELRDAACDYRHNRADYFFDVVAQALELDRARGAPSVLVDARGEGDLRGPMRSSLTWAERTNAPARLPLRAEAARLEALRAALGGAGAAAAPRATAIALAAPAPPRLPHAAPRRAARGI
jgi:hypothetical protein